MHVDRNRFLWLAASLASNGGCAGRQADSELTLVDVGPASSQPAVAQRTTTAQPRTDATPEARCQKLQPGRDTACHHFAQTVAECGSYVAVLQLAAARRAIACLESKSATQAICDEDASDACFVAAISEQPLAAGSLEPCEELMNHCAAQPADNITLAICRAGYSAVREELRSILTGCITEYCTLDYCYGALEYRSRPR